MDIGVVTPSKRYIVVMFAELACVVANQPQRQELKGILDELKNQKIQLDKIMVCCGNLQYF